MWDNYKRNINSDQAKLTDTGSLRKDSVFVLQFGELEKYLRVCLVGRLKHETRWSTTCKLESLVLM